MHPGRSCGGKRKIDHPAMLGSCHPCALLLDMAEGYVQQPCIWVEGAAGVLLTLTLLQCSSLMQLLASESSSVWCVHGDFGHNCMFSPQPHVTIDLSHSAGDMQYSLEILRLHL